MPHWPTSFRSPQRDFGKKAMANRSFQSGWFSRWSICDEEKTHASVLLYTGYIMSVYCGVLQHAISTKALSTDFVTGKTRLLA